MTPSPPPTGTATLYSEDRCALRWPLWILGVALPAAGLAWLIGLAIGGQFALAFPGVLVFDVGVLGSLSLWSNWPTGIRIDTEQIRIGGIRHAERRARRHTRPPSKPPEIAAQRYQVFTCPRRAIRRITVLSDPADLRELRRQARRYGRRSSATMVPAGFLQAPFMRGALLIYLDPHALNTQRFRPSYSGSGIRAHASPSPTWLAPTRHPAKLRAALAQLPGPWPPADDTLNPADPIRFH